MNESTTRISDLPENITMQIPPYGVTTNPVSGSGSGAGPNVGGGSTTFDPTGLQNTYIPMNIHPNPYGNAQQPQTMPLPQQGPTASFPNNLSPEQHMMLQNMPQQRLPSRDIQIDSGLYTQDEQIQANYIPKSSTSTDYVRDYENLTESKLEKHERNNKRVKLLDTIMNEIQTPLTIGLLYFIFQLPFLNSLLFKRFSFFSLYNSDGNINFNGILLKSVLFGTSFYIIMKVIQFISEI